MNHPHPTPVRAQGDDAAPRVVAWELTRRCNLQCRHCRGAALDQAYEGELETAEAHRLIDGLADFARPLLIFTGGEPMTRDDLPELVGHATERGLRAVLAPCGHLLTPENAAALRDAGIRAMSISLDGATAATHDAFRGVTGAFERSLRGLRCALEAGVAVQVNTTVTRANVDELPALLDLAVSLGAATFDLFFLVPTGRGAGLRDLEVSPAQAERTLQWVRRASQTAPIRVKTTCAPQYARILAAAPASTATDFVAPHVHGAGARPSGGCLAGRGFVFISHQGVLQPCGFLDVACGDLRAVDFDFGRAYRESNVFNALRDASRYKGKCGRCEYVTVCGGCRARAYEATGDYLAEEPVCAYVPRGGRKRDVPGRS